MSRKKPFTVYRQDGILMNLTNRSAWLTLLFQEAVLAPVKSLSCHFCLNVFGFPGSMFSICPFLGSFYAELFIDNERVQKL